MGVGGALLDPRGFRVAAGRAPDVTFNGTSFLVVWQSGQKIEAALVSGTFTVGAAIEVSAGTAPRGAPSVAASGPDFLVAWEDCRNAAPSCAVGDPASQTDLFAARLTPGGTVLDPAGLPLVSAAGSQGELSVSGGAGGWGIAWRDRRTGASDIRAARISTGGVVSADVLVSGAANDQFAPASAWDGTQYVIVWQDRRTDFGDIYAARMSTAGAVLDPSGVLLHLATSLQYAPDLACGPASCLVTWHDHRAPALLLNGTRVDGALAVLDPVGMPLSGGGKDPDQAAIAFGGGEFLVLWEDDPDGTGLDVYRSRVTAAGLPVGSPLLVSTADAEQREASAATGFRVAWRESREVRVAQISPEAVPGSTTSIATGSRAPAASAGLVAFVTGEDIYASWLDGGFPVCTAIGEQIAPALDCLAERCLIAWSDRRSGSRDIYGAFVDQAAGVWPVDGFAIAAGTSDQSAPAVSAQDGGFIVAWVEQRIATYGDVEAARVELDGGVAPFRVLAGPLDEAAPALAGGAAAWLETLDDAGVRVRFMGGSFATDSPPALAFDGESYVLGFSHAGEVRAVRFAVDGGQLDAPPFVVGQGFEVSLATDAMGKTVLAYARFDATAKNVQLYARLALTGDAGWADAGAADAGAPDAGRVDAGPADAGLEDAGVADAGLPDAATPDAGPPDVKQPRLGDEQLRPAAGCGCSSGAAIGFFGWAAAFLLLRRKRTCR